LTFPTPSLITYNTTEMMHLKKNMDTIVITVFVCSHLILKVFIVCAALSILKSGLHVFETKDQVLTSYIRRCSAPNSPHQYTTPSYTGRAVLHLIFLVQPQNRFFALAEPRCSCARTTPNQARNSSGIHADSDRVYWQKGTPWMQRPLYSSQNK